jgi:uncharacterized phage infection (PIP) family protein YhgE
LWIDRSTLQLQNQTSNTYTYMLKKCSEKICIDIFNQKETILDGDQDLPPHPESYCLRNQQTAAHYQQTSQGLSRTIAVMGGNNLHVPPVTSRS